MHAPDPHAWLGIELRHLAALQAVAEERSFVRASRRLGYTQSAITNQIAALERLVGARLVERARGGSSVSLTATGQLLYEHATAIMARLLAARTDVAASQADQSSVLRVGYFQSVGPVALPRIACAFRERAPSVRLELELGDAEHLLQEVVAAGSLDVAFVSAPVRVEALESVHLVDDPFVLLSPLGEGDPDFSTRPLLAYKPCAVQRVHEAMLERTHQLPGTGSSGSRMRRRSRRSSPPGPRTACCLRSRSPRPTCASTCWRAQVARSTSSGSATGRRPRRWGISLRPRKPRSGHSRRNTVVTQLNISSISPS